MYDRNNAPTAADYAMDSARTARKENETLRAFAEKVAGYD